MELNSDLELKRRKMREVNNNKENNENMEVDLIVGSEFRFE